MGWWGVPGGKEGMHELHQTKPNCALSSAASYTAVPRLWHIETEELCASGGDTADDERVLA